MHFCSPTAVTMCSGLVHRAVRWDGTSSAEELASSAEELTSSAEELNCASLGVNADGLCCKWYYAAWGRGCLGDFLGLEPKVAQSFEMAACTTGGVGSPVTVAEDVGRTAVMQKCTRQSGLHPSN